MQLTQPVVFRDLRAALCQLSARGRAFDAFLRARLPQAPASTVESSVAAVRALITRAEAAATHLGATALDLLPVRAQLWRTLRELIAADVEYTRATLATLAERRTPAQWLDLVGGAAAGAARLRLLMPADRADADQCQVRLTDAGCWPAGESGRPVREEKEERVRHSAESVARIGLH